MDNQTRDKLCRMLGTQALSNSLVKLYDRFEARRRAGRSNQAPDANQLALLSMMAEIANPPLVQREKPHSAADRSAALRNRNLSARVSQREFDRIEQAAQAAGCSLSDYIVRRCLPTNSPK